MAGTQAARGFFRSRRALDIKGKRHDGKQGASYKNVPKIIAIIVSRRLATLHELNTIYGIEDAHNLLEIILIDEANGYHN